jgi:hypothetical protein
LSEEAWELRGSVVLVAPQGFEPSEMEEDMANLVEDAHMDAHTSKKYLMRDFLSLHLTFWDPFAPRVASDIKRHAS